ncbi:hypothetical protein C6Y14_11970 [Streptomyces dioscori]|uniref:Uncharacterized protein n=1 Tax=Streptomyces dioscori TaxID=2109333 RepID=A0A2P8Q9G9_9ACTN|nr:hypothetical protein C6Y14_11970 [Streptomyces dioscori]
MLQRAVELAQHPSFAFIAHLLEARITASIGAVDDALGSAPMEAQIDPSRTELIKPRKPHHSLVGTWGAPRSPSKSRFDMMTEPFRDSFFGTGTL